MDFVPVYMDEVEAPASAVEGRASVVIPADRRQLLGVRSEPLTRAPLSRAIRTVGRIVPDERLLHHVHTKYDGFIEHVYVDFIGKYVKKGEPLLSIYSPELYATQQEYLLARKAVRELAGNETRCRGAKRRTRRRGPAAPAPVGHPARRDRDPRERGRRPARRGSVFRSRAATSSRKWRCTACA